MTPSNLEFMRQLVTNGPDVHPGANFVETHGGNQKKFLKYCDRQEMAKLLKPGDKVRSHNNRIFSIYISHILGGETHD